jgi:hypothetical protein
MAEEWVRYVVIGRAEVWVVEVVEEFAPEASCIVSVKRNSRWNAISACEAPKGMRPPAVRCPRFCESDEAAGSATAARGDAIRCGARGALRKG